MNQLEIDALITDCAKDNESAYLMRKMVGNLLYHQNTISQQLRRSEVQLQMLLEHAPVGITMAADTDDMPVQSNQAMADFLGYSVEEIEAMPLKDYMARSSHPRTYDKEQQYLAEVFAGSRDAYRMEKKYIRKDGTHRWGDLSTHVLRDTEGAIINTMSMVVDITERKNTEAALRESEQKYRSVIQTMSEGVVMQDANGVIITSNKRAEEILGLSPDQMMGRSSIDPRWHSIHEDGSPYPGTEYPTIIALQTGQAQHNKIMGIHKPDGSLTWISINAEPLLRKKRRNPYGVVATFTDITVWKHQRETFFQRQLEKERVLLLREFIQNMAHEFRTPLSIISSNAYLSVRAKTDEKRQHYASNIRNHVELINHLVDDLALMSELDSGFLMNLQDVRIGLLLSQIVESYRSQYKRNFEADYRQDEYLVCDPRYLTIALKELLENAIKHTPENGNIHIISSHDETHCVINIIDDGEGIQDEHKDLIFERFWRADDAHTTAGFGLGLSIAHSVIVAHGGELNIHSKPDNGTEVIIRLPLKH